MKTNIYFNNDCSNICGVIFLFASRVRAYGPGIEPSGPVVGAPANFTVETFSAGKGNVEVTVENPAGQFEPVSYITRFAMLNKILYLIDSIPV